MQNLYHILFKILLILPILGIANSIFMNKFSKYQRIINNIVYASLTTICFCILIAFPIYKTYNLNLFIIAKDVPIIFSTNSINVMFGMFMCIVVFFLNLVFQNYFKNLNLHNKYPLYNKQASYLYLFYILISFSDNIIISIFLYLLILAYSFFLITNPDLKEFRRNYKIVFCVSSVCSMIFIFMTAFYFFYSNNNLFIIQKTNSLYNISGYWILPILFFLLLINISAPFYLIFREKFYYEDLLPLFIIFFFPFVFLNTFLFIKILYYIFYNNFNVLKYYFYYSGFFNILLFLISCFFTGKFIKNSIKFILLFCIMNFIIFASQLLFIRTDLEILKILSNFLLFILSILLVVLSYTGILFLLLKLDITDLSSLYKNSKVELNFFIFCLFMPILINLISFFNLNLHNFNILYLINLGEILIAFLFYIVYIFISLNKKSKNSTKKPNEVQDFDRIKLFIPQIALLFVFLFFLLLKGQIARYIIFYRN